MKIFTQTRLIKFLLLAGMVILAGCGIFAYKQIQELVESNRWIVHTHKVIGKANETLLALINAESQISFYALVDDKYYIQNVPSLIAKVQQNMNDLESLTQDNPIQITRINNLRFLVNKKIELIQKIISLNNKTEKATITKLTSSGERQDLRKQILSIITAFKQDEENLLQLRNDYAINKLQVSNLMFIVFGVLSELFIILSFILLNYNLHQREILEKKRKEAEKELLLSNEKLKVSEERYLLATEGSAVGLWDWEVGTDKVFYSSYFKKMLDYSDQEFPNSLQSLEKAIHPYDHDKFWEKVNQHLVHHIPFMTEYRLKTKSGEYKWFQAAGKAVWDSANNPIRMPGSIIDITERKSSQQRLKIQHVITEILSQASSLEEISINIIKEICNELGWEFGAIWMLNQEKKELECTGVWHQPSPLLEIFEKHSYKMQFASGIGYPGQVWKLGKPTWFSNIQTDKNFPRADIAKRSGLNSAFGFPIITEKKILGVIEYFTTENEGPKQNILDLMSVIGAEIGQFIRRKTAENELRKSETYKTAILESASDSIITINEQLNILSFNPQAAKEFNYFGNELLNINVQTILPSFNLNPEKSSNNLDIEMLGIRKNGESFPVEIKAAKMTIDNQSRFVVIIRDNTERNKVNKMKNEFVSVVSHELRTPITSIRGALGLILGGAVGDISEKINKLLLMANNNCERLLMLINDILDIDKLESGKMNFKFKIVDISQLIKDAIDANKIFADKYNVSLVLTESKTGLKVNVDPDRLIQVLTNLISNAAKFSFPGEKIKISIQESDKNVRVLVSNKGLGIPLDFQSAIFQKFSQADSTSTREKGGTGLGLNISKSIIEKLGGSLNFTSKPNEVTTFYFDLPLCKDNLELTNATQKQKEIQERDHKQERVLICEDDEDQAKYLSQILESTGFLIDIAPTINAAKKLLEQNTYHVLLLDLLLPDQDGITFIRELRASQKTRSLPIIVISVIAQTGRALLGGEALSVIDWLNKPIDFDKLLKTIDSVKTQNRSQRPSILYIQNDTRISEVVNKLLDAHANIIQAANCGEALDKLKNLKFDLVILDSLLTDGNVEKLLETISNNKLPIIVYSSLSPANDLPKTVKQVFLKSDISNEQLLNLINHVLETAE